VSFVVRCDFQRGSILNHRRSSYLIQFALWLCIQFVALVFFDTGELTPRTRIVESVGIFHNI